MRKSHSLAFVLLLLIFVIYVDRLFACFIATDAIHCEIYLNMFFSINLFQYRLVLEYDISGANSSIYSLACLIIVFNNITLS